MRIKSGKCHVVVEDPGIERLRKERWWLREGYDSAGEGRCTVCSSVCLPGQCSVYPRHVEFQSPSHSPQSCIFVVGLCDMRECGKNGSLKTKNAQMETPNRWNDIEKERRKVCKRQVKWESVRGRWSEWNGERKMEWNIGKDRTKLIEVSEQSEP